jgi:hypothetical protein
MSITTATLMRALQPTPPLSPSTGSRSRPLSIVSPGAPSARCLAAGLEQPEHRYIAVLLAFVFGYALTLIPLVRANIAFGTALGLAFAADTASITLMEIVDNAIMLITPGAMDAGLASPLFWGSLAFSLIIAGVAAFPFNRWLISRGLGHAVLHQYH